MIGALEEAFVNALFRHRLRQVLHFAAKLDLGPVAIDQSAIFLHRLDRRMAIQHPAKLGVELFVRQRNLRLGHANAVVPCNVELRRNLKRCLELQRLSVEELHIQQLRLRHRAQLLVVDRLAERLRHQALQNLLPDLLHKLRPDQRFRHLARAEPRDTRQLLIALRDRLEGLRYLIRWDFYFNLAHQLRIQRRGSFMLVIMLMVVVMIVAMFMVVGLRQFRRLFGGLVCLCHLSRGQIHAFRWSRVCAVTLA